MFVNLFIMKLSSILIFSIIIQISTSWIIVDNFDYYDNETFTLLPNEVNNTADINSLIQSSPIEANQAFHSDTIEKSHLDIDIDNNIREKRSGNDTVYDQHDEDYKMIVAKNTTNSSDITYDYNQLKAEYDDNVKKAEEEVAKMNKKEYTEPEFTCSTDGFFDIGWKSIKCLIYQYRHDQITAKKGLRGLFHIVMFWLGFVFIVHSICFCYCGYLRCFCPWRICFPEDVEEEVKNYIVLNPPGQRNTDHTPAYYKPTETEIYLYNNLWNTVYRD